MRLPKGPTFVCQGPNHRGPRTCPCRDRESHEHPGWCMSCWSAWFWGYERISPGPTYVRRNGKPPYGCLGAERFGKRFGRLIAALIHGNRGEVERLTNNAKGALSKKFPRKFVTVRSFSQTDPPVSATTKGGRDVLSREALRNGRCVLATDAIEESYKCHKSRRERRQLAEMADLMV